MIFGSFVLYCHMNLSVFMQAVITLYCDNWIARTIQWNLRVVICVVEAFYGVLFSFCVWLLRYMVYVHQCQ